MQLDFFNVILPILFLSLYPVFYCIVFIFQIFSLRKEYSKRPSICVSPVIRRESFGSNIASNIGNGSEIGNFFSNY